MQLAVDSQRKLLPSNFSGSLDLLSYPAPWYAAGLPVPRHREFGKVASADRVPVRRSLLWSKAFC